MSEAKQVGKNVTIAKGANIAGMENMVFGDEVYIGPGAVLYSTRANLIIGSYVNFGPGVTIITGDHRMDVIGEYMKMVPEEDKLPENDRDVIIDDDVWIGTGAIILKGVHIGEGSVIAAGAVVTKDVAPFSLYISPSKQKRRFTDEQILEHKKRLAQKYGKPTQK